MSTTDHKVILLTGASRGIGLAIAQFLLKASHKLVLVARSEEPLQKLKAEYPGQVEYLAADLNDFLNGAKAVDICLKSFTRIDSIIINHGTLTPVKRIADCTAEEWKTLYDTNVFSAVAFVQAALPSLRKTKGRIIFTSSGAAVGAYSTWGAYGSSKAALHHLTMTLNVEEPDITSISVRPGVVDTDMQKVVRGHSTVMDAKDAEKFKTLHESGKLLRPEQPGNVMARLALGAGHELGGKLWNWNDEELSDFQDS
ncbi:NAD(P)-binding Rossmann-fold containing protein [Glarea lozoyensis ATCC 20868]|uniref:NAD(P)-binding Rossmann-fold containing protein n=1 Tax=Glarea lozoyensis (strain ATCC 20868 / MF5171) TaxID=1116229 RepID=S3DGZ7_GLAL2|nr:NAD(P)-binding Rossmann-fold containing protein [Glarea lozoyensis ATCC 20868]EPE36985.1 NAD(P)-binding Rossmann-fold containing protein [Glarea lozoyensis ATCC 20868]